MGDTLDAEYQRAVAAVKAAGMEPADPLKLPLEAARRAQDRYFAFLAGDPPPVAAVHDHSVHGPAGPFGLRLYFSVVDVPRAVIVFVRGAGWWAGSADSHDRTMRLLATRSGCTVCGVDYHRAPEAQFPTQLCELSATIAWLRERGPELGVDARRMILAGESAGASLCALAASSLAAGRSPQVDGLILFYGNFSGPSLKSRAYSRWVWANYLGSDALPPNPAAVPIAMPVDGFPPTWLGVGESDPLLDDTVEFAAKLEAARIPVTVKRYPGLPHGFVMTNRLCAPADRAIEDAAIAAAQLLAAPPS
jgi:acetyl esterase